MLRCSNCLHCAHNRDEHLFNTITITELFSFVICQVEIGKGYTSVEWREDLKLILRKAAEGEMPGVFLFTDTQVSETRKTVTQFLLINKKLLFTSYLRSIFSNKTEFDVRRSKKNLSLKM